jgi:hypothetical protein
MWLSVIFAERQQAIRDSSGCTLAGEVHQYGRDGVGLLGYSQCATARRTIFAFAKLTPNVQLAANESCSARYRFSARLGNP